MKHLKLTIKNRSRSSQVKTSNYSKIPIFNESLVQSNQTMHYSSTPPPKESIETSPNMPQRFAVIEYENSKAKITIPVNVSIESLIIAAMKAFHLELTSINSEEGTYFNCYFAN